MAPRGLGPFVLQCSVTRLANGLRSSRLSLLRAMQEQLLFVIKTPKRVLVSL